MQNPTPPIVRSLGALANILKKAQAYCKELNIDESVLLGSRLYPNMLNLTWNVTIACDNAKGIAARLSQTENPKHEDTEKTFDELYARIEKTIEFIESIPDEAYEGAESRMIKMKFGPEEVDFAGAADYLGIFAIPNFYFHLTTSYDILRHNGVPLGKRDYLGAN